MLCLQLKQLWFGSAINVDRVVPLKIDRQKGGVTKWPDDSASERPLHLV